MYKITKKDAIKTLHRCHILSLPIPIYSIEDIITDEGYIIVNCAGINYPCIFRNELIMPEYKTMSACRYGLAHELGHIIIHGRVKSGIDMPSKHEAVADAFALYFTMPPQIFEKDIKRMDEWELSDKYGVPIEQVLNRYKLCDECQYH
ncbi:ImmA/IrrE family metallo-endopeptidase [Acetobacterium paludosum]|uniref:ImmA/IrrE family metallo-endopeptidase n=1 Tax=Acetobacterium paludosum TaxID=52693 RepID=A0A923KTI6_9FIRM|nr:ImmA/IrrE family metallo-endopeptidase [Acetobacterium paludosum]MBC3889462.1 ImmA/IrrE family metallo-endopeptidase [Acetobacterium paludosum]